MSTHTRMHTHTHACTCMYTLGHVISFICHRQQKDRSVVHTCAENTRTHLHAHACTHWDHVICFICHVSSSHTRTHTHTHTLACTCMYMHVHGTCLYTLGPCHLFHLPQDRSVVHTCAEKQAPSMTPEARNARNCKSACADKSARVYAFHRKGLSLRFHSKPPPPSPPPGLDCL